MVFLLVSLILCMKNTPSLLWMELLTLLFFDWTHTYFYLDTRQCIELSCTQSDWTKSHTGVDHPRYNTSFWLASADQAATRVSSPWSWTRQSETSIGWIGITCWQNDVNSCTLVFFACAHPGRNSPVEALVVLTIGCQKGTLCEKCFLFAVGGLWRSVETDRKNRPFFWKQTGKKREKKMASFRWWAVVD